MQSPRIWVALVAFTLIGVLAFTTLEGKFRQAVWIVLVGLAVRLVVTHLMGDQPTSSEASKPPKSF